MLAQGLEHQPARASQCRNARCAWQRSDQTPHQRRRHLPQSRIDRAAGWCSATGAAGGMAAGAPPLLLGGHHGQDPEARRAAGAHRW